MQIVKLKLAELAPNTGQIPGLPINPRQWTKGDVDKIAASLKETPELFEARPVLVIPHDGKYVILGGNLRYEGARVNKEKEVPAIIFPEDSPLDLLKRVVILDNGSFGAWDYDALANEWDDLPLGDWGVPAWNNGEFELDALSIDPVAGVGNSDTGETAITFVFKTEEAEQINAYCKENGKDILTAKIVELCQTAEAK